MTVPTYEPVPEPLEESHLRVAEACAKVAGNAVRSHPPASPAVAQLVEVHVPQLLAEIKRLRGIEEALDELKTHNGVGWYRATYLLRAIDEIAIPSLTYCETKYGYDDAARLNLEAGVTETVCFGLSPEEAEEVRAERASGEAPASAARSDGARGGA